MSDIPHSVGQAAATSGDLMEIKERLNRLLRFLEIDGANTRLRADAIDAAIRVDELEIAERLLNEISESERASAFWRFNQASLYIAQRRFGKAERLLLQLAAEGEATAAVSYNLAFIAFSENRYGDCVTALSHWFEPMNEGSESVDPLFQTLWLRALHRAGALDRALTWAQGAEGLGVLVASAKGVAALIAVDAGDFSKAMRFADSAMSEGDGHPEAVVAKASALIARREPAAAKQLLLQALKTNEDGRTRSTLGTAQLMEGEGADARDSFTQAVKAMPGHIGSWHGLGWADYLTGDLDAAERAFIHAVSLDRNFAESHGALAVVYAVRGRRVEAEKEGDLALKLDAACASARYAKLILAGKAKDASAVEVLARVLLARRSF